MCFGPRAPTDQADLHQDGPGTRRWRLNMARLPDYPFGIRPVTTEEGVGISSATLTSRTVCPTAPPWLGNHQRETRAQSDCRSVEGGRPRGSGTQATPGKGSSSKFVATVPKSVHARLASRAKAEGVSLHTQSAIQAPRPYAVGSPASAGHGASRSDHSSFVLGRVPTSHFDAIERKSA